MTTEDIKRLLLPERYQVAISFLVALILAGLFLGDVIYDRFFGQTILNTPEARSIYLGSLGKLSEVPVIRTAVIIFFWGSVGLGAYVFYLAVSNALTEARNEVVIETAYTNKGPLIRFLTRVVPQLAAAAALVAFVYLSASFTLPALLSVTARGILALFQISAILLLLFGVTGIAVTVYLAWTLGQLMFALE
jgi:hypothetical protein